MMMNRLSMMIASLMLLLAKTIVSVVTVTAASTTATSSSTTISQASRSSEQQMPMNVLDVVQDLESQGIEEVRTACLITSNGVSRQQRSTLLKQLLLSSSSSSNSAMADDEDEDTPSLGESLVTGSTANGLILAQPMSLRGLLTSIDACDGTVLYYADPTDLSRGEGLLYDLGPAMEQILLSSKKNTAAATASAAADDDDARVQETCLVVLVDPGADAGKVKSQLEKAAEVVLANLIAATGTNNGVAVFEDVFDRVVYLSPEQAVEQLSTAGSVKPVDDVASNVRTAMGASRTLRATTAENLSARDVAAARILGPMIRKQVDAAVQQVEAACFDELMDGTLKPKRVADFGQLCDAAIQQAMQNVATELADCPPSLQQSGIGQQIQVDLQTQLCDKLGDLFTQQIELLKTASFDGFREGMSKLRITPYLASDIDEQVNKALRSFVQSARKLLMTGGSSSACFWSFQPTRLQLRNEMKDIAAKQVLKARAGGQFKPIPRKGVTVGMHWLLPKPFGNDYRQEPWLVHATDNMVYVPKDKITDVSPDDVANGDWRDKIVPSPIGNDMLYMQ